MSEPIRHHYIPVFYLKQWTGSDGRLCEYSRPYKETKAKRKAPKATGYVDHLYTIPGVSPENAQFVEKVFLQAVDDWAARAHRVFLTNSGTKGQIDRRVQAGWARFLYSLIVRNPEQLVLIQKKADENPPEIPDAALRADYEKRSPNNLTFEEYKEWTQKNPLKLPAQRILPNLINSERVIGELIGWKWGTFILGNAKHSLLTSDRPIIMTSGLAAPDAYVAIPLSPRIFFVASRSDETQKAFQEMTENKLVSIVNNKVAEQAIKYVYGTDDSQLRFVIKRLGKMAPSTPLG